MPRLIAVTGTNGKTSTVSFAHQLLEAAGVRAASFSTFGLRIGGEAHSACPILPGRAGLEMLLEQMSASGVEVIVWEAFSGSLSTGVLDSLAPDAAALTTLTRDHLDVHGTMAAYEDAKARLFERLLLDGGAAVLPLDRPEGRSFATRISHRLLQTVGFGRSTDNDVQLRTLHSFAGAEEIACRLHGLEFTTRVSLAGTEMLDNLCAALALVDSVVDWSIDVWATAMRAIKPPPGRVESVGQVRGARVLVDYAHNPSALASTLRMLRARTEGRLHLVFGCGGERDPGKRPEMGSVAAALADRIVVTDDNPRREAAAQIRAAILAGCPGAVEVSDRAEAIEMAMSDLRRGDTLLVAGKGHEDTQTIMNDVRAFSDRQVIRELIEGPGSAATATDLKPFSFRTPCKE